VEDFREYEPYEEGNKFIMLESDSTSELGISYSIDIGMEK